MSDPARVYVDSNVLIYAVEGTPPDPDVSYRCQKLLGLIQQGRVMGITSELTLAEVLVEPSRRKLFDIKRAYLALLSSRAPVFELWPVTRQILVESAEYRAQIYPLRLGPTEDRRNFLADAIHVLTAVAASATHYAGSDKRVRLPISICGLNPRRPEFDAMLAELA